MIYEMWLFECLFQTQFILKTIPNPGCSVARLGGWATFDHIGRGKMMSGWQMVDYVNIWWDFENTVKTILPNKTAFYSQKHCTTFSKPCVHSLLLLNLREVFSIFPQYYKIWIKQHVIT